MILIPGLTNPDDFIMDMIAIDAVTLKKFKDPTALIAAAHIFLYISEYPDLKISKTFGCTPEIVIQFFGHEEPFQHGYQQYFYFLAKYTLVEKKRANSLLRAAIAKALEQKLYSDNRLEYLNLVRIGEKSYDFEEEIYEKLLKILREKDYKKDDAWLFLFILNYIEKFPSKGHSYLHEFVTNSDSIMKDNKTFKHRKAIERLRLETIKKLPDQSRKSLQGLYDKRKGKSLLDELDDLLR